MSTNSNVKFLSVSEFKSLINADQLQLDVVRNPKGDNKLFVSIGDYSYKCQQDISNDKPIKFIVPVVDDELVIDQACLINVKESTNNVLFTL